jgi:hypothetical protein
MNRREERRLKSSTNATPEEKAGGHAQLSGLWVTTGFATGHLTPI